MPARHRVWLSLGVLTAAIPASVLAAGLWPGEDTAHRTTTVTTQAPESTKPADTTSPSDRAEHSDETTRSSAPEPTTTPPAPPPEAPAESVVTKPVADDEPAPVANPDGMSREEMVRSRVMTPHPRPPVTRNVSPDIQRRMEQAEEDVIDLGTIHPEGQEPTSEQP